MRSVKLIEAGKLILDTGTGTIRVDEETVKEEAADKGTAGDYSGNEEIVEEDGDLYSEQDLSVAKVSLIPLL